MSSNDTSTQVLPRAQYVADGEQTVFSFPFPVFAYGDLEVFVGAERQRDGYTVHGAGNAAGGTVRFALPPAVGSTVVLRRSVPVETTLQAAAQELSIPPDAAALIYAFTEGLSDKAHAAMVDGAVPIQTVYALIEEALKAGAEAVLESMAESTTNTKVGAPLAMLPMSSYPRDHDPGPDTWWGPEVVVRVPTEFDPAYYVAHLEADEWTVREPGSPPAWSPLEGTPDGWLPIGVAQPASSSGAPIRGVASLRAKVADTDPWITAKHEELRRDSGLDLDGALYRIAQLHHDMDELRRASSTPRDRHGYALCDRCGHDCGMDTMVPAEVWAKIGPRGDDSGMLCPSTILEAHEEYEAWREREREIEAVENWNTGDTALDLVGYARMERVRMLLETELPARDFTDLLFRSRYYRSLQSQCDRIEEALHRDLEQLVASTLPSRRQRQPHRRTTSASPSHDQYDLFDNAHSNNQPGDGPDQRTNDGVGANHIPVAGR